MILRNNANLSTGGTATDVTDDVHPEVALRAIAAAQMVGLDICGVDVVCDSVLRPLEEQSGGVVEVNAAPGLRMHLSPSFGKGRDVGEAVMATMFPDGDDGRIPVIAVTGTNGKSTTTAMIAEILQADGRDVRLGGNIGRSLLAEIERRPAWRPGVDELLVDLRGLDGRRVGDSRQELVVDDEAVIGGEMHEPASGDLMASLQIGRAHV